MGGTAGPDDRRMRTVGRSEGVVDVGVVTFDERLDEGGVIRRLARIEPEVVEQGHLGEPLGELRRTGSTL